VSGAAGAIIGAVADDPVHARMLSIPHLVNADAGLVRRGRYCSATFLLEAGDAACLLRVHEGRVASLERGPFLMRPWTFAIRASTEAAMVKVFASEMAGRVVDRVLQIHGGMGYMKESPVERAYRDARILRIYEGTSEVQRMIIAEELLKA